MHVYMGDSREMTKSQRGGLQNNNNKGKFHGNIRWSEIGDCVGCRYSSFLFLHTENVTDLETGGVWMCPVDWTSVRSAIVPQLYKLFPLGKHSAGLRRSLVHLLGFVVVFVGFVVVVVVAVSYGSTLISIFFFFFKSRGA